MEHPLDGTGFAKLFTEGTSPSGECASLQKKDRIGVRSRDWKQLDDGELFDMRGESDSRIERHTRVESGKNILKKILNPTEEALDPNIVLSN